MTAPSTTPPSTSAASVGPVIAVHVGLAVAGTAALLTPAPARGWAVLACVVAYAAALILTCRRTGHPLWASLAVFVCLISVFQVLPDWILADVLGTLRFPDQGGPRVGDAVPVAMALMWAAPLFIAIALAGLRPGRAALTAFLVFGAAELLAPVVGLWEPLGDTTRLLGVAVYVPPAEAALGWASAIAWRATADRSLAVKIAAAAAVSVFYTGALVASYFLVDVADWRVSL